MIIRQILIFSIISLLITSCSTKIPDTTFNEIVENNESIELISPTQTIEIIDQQSLSIPTQINTVTSSVLINRIQSPLSEISIEELTLIISRYFILPIDGHDDGHHGIDLSFYQYKKWKSIDNHPVMSIVPGKVAGVIDDRFPYGNTIIIETSLGNISTHILNNISIPDRFPLYTPASALNCPEKLAGYDPGEQDRSLYILYAHLKSNPSYAIGDLVEEEDIIGYVGTTGFSKIPHLHLEIRVGPSNVSFGSIAEYINDVTPEEVNNYCLWRVSGVFKLIDPMKVLK